MKIQKKGSFWSVSFKYEGVEECIYSESLIVALDEALRVKFGL